MRTLVITLTMLTTTIANAQVSCTTRTLPNGIVLTDCDGGSRPPVQCVTRRLANGIVITDCS